MVGNLAGVSTGQEVTLVAWVHDEAAALGSSSESPNLWVGQDVTKSCTDLKQSAVLVFVAGVSNPLVKSRFDAMEFQWNHF